MRTSSGLRLSLVLAVLVAVGPVNADTDPADTAPADTDPTDVAFTDANLPAGWRVEQTIVVAPEQLPGFTARLGGRFASLTNQVVSVGGFQTRANVLRGATEKDADAIHAKMLELRGATFVRRDGTRVIEVAGHNALVAARVFAALGLGDAEPTRYVVSFRAALVDELDYTSGNEVFNLFLQRAKNPDDASIEKRIRAITADWRFGRRLRLLSPGYAGMKLVFTPPPEKANPERVDGLSAAWTFADPPVELGIPYVDVEAACSVPARFAPVAGAATTAALQPTTFWPVEAEPIAARARGVVEGRTEPRARLRALLNHVNRQIRYGGAQGTRDGVETVLERGFGRCWDRSDALVTLCRAAGLPARQVAGWVPPIGAGHVWAEVHLEGEGWLAVDPTTTWLGVSADYIPLYGTEIGVMPIVYLRMPAIRRVETEPEGVGDR